jgi:hypothetical protein
LAASGAPAVAPAAAGDGVAVAAAGGGAAGAFLHAREPDINNSSDSGSARFMKFSRIVRERRNPPS